LRAWPLWTWGHFRQIDCNTHDGDTPLLNRSHNADAQARQLHVLVTVSVPLNACSDERENAKTDADAEVQTAVNFGGDEEGTNCPTHALM
jgi:hypothetical protein